MKNNKAPSISIKVLKNNYLVKQVRSRKTKRIYHFIQAEKYSNCLFRVNVDYGNRCTNSGDYLSKKDLILALKAFTEK